MARWTLLALVPCALLSGAFGTACTKSSVEEREVASGPNGVGRAVASSKENLSPGNPPLRLGPTSIIDLLVNGESLEKDRVRVRGYMAVGGNGVYLTEAYARYRATEYGVGLTFRTCQDKPQDYALSVVEMQDLANKLVLVQGTVSTQLRGHLGEFDIGLCAIEAVEEVTFPKKVPSEAE